MRKWHATSITIIRKKEKTQNSNIDREKYIREVLELNNISRDIIINLIDRIEIFEDKTININVSFNKNKKIKLSIDNFCKM